MLINKFNIKPQSQIGIYKIYLWKLDGVIVYVGCTKHAIESRMLGHIQDGITNKKSKTFCFIKDLPTDKKIDVDVVFCFQSKYLATVFERFLINFIYRFINPNLLNTHKSFTEAFCNPTNNKSYSNSLDVY